VGDFTFFTAKSFNLTISKRIIAITECYQQRRDKASFNIRKIMGTIYTRFNWRQEKYRSNFYLIGKEIKQNETKIMSSSKICW